ncbi:MAG: DNA-binding protein [Candidatus Rokuibacteriota bacterium]|nr:MAG: DNA-binding protein [Candidatus Rokubacteria bacterium]PYM61640.1 MAG: DNA-binding protein [Candidatus Rokubacteria bacterium]PYN66066.1 MAG: DNA-binding protein [Candidatus Rokubacteria bacterium]
MADILVDSNILLDVLTNDPHWFERSAATLARLGADHELVINPIVYAEVSVGFDRIEDLDAALPDEFFRREALPWEAAFLAGKCFVKYRRAGGARRAPLPDFYIGAHAAVRGMPLLTRDAGRYRTYFPKLELVVP